MRPTSGNPLDGARAWFEGIVGMGALGLFTGGGLVFPLLGVDYAPAWQWACMVAGGVAGAVLVRRSRAPRP